ncbi:MAG TPA: ABC transporter ATP-binding protein [Actinomycetota bacterium]|nr:ABC transporter ATP-binding protein [Actinomycetota bacterium]
MTALSLNAVTVRLGEVVALKDVSLALAPGSRLAVVGASGSGKTTLLRAVVGLAGIHSGTISLDGQEVAGPKAFVPAHRRAVGYVPQDGALFPHLTVERNIGFGIASRAHRYRQVNEAAGLVALEPQLLDRYPHELSGGQQQRVALARALAAKPRMIVLDEPFSALDTALRESARRSVMKVLDATGMTAILVTHDRDEALIFGDTVGVLDSGQLVQAGAPQTLFDDPATPEIAAFLADTCFLAGSINGDTAVTALGPVTIRHRHGSGGLIARVMLRPNQFAVSAAGVPNARVKNVEWRCATSRIRIRATSRGEDLALELPTDQTRGMAPDDLVHIRILGSGVAYSATSDRGRTERVELGTSRTPVTAGQPS